MPDAVRNRPVENGETAFGLAAIGAASCSWTSTTEPARVTGVPPLAAWSWARKTVRVPDPVCGICGTMTPFAPPSWLQLVKVPL